MDTQMTRIGRIFHGFFETCTKKSVKYPPDPCHQRVH